MSQLHLHGVVSGPMRIVTPEQLKARLRVAIDEVFAMCGAGDYCDTITITRAEHGHYGDTTITTELITRDGYVDWVD